MQKNIPTLSHPPFSSELALCDFLFLGIKTHLNEHHFCTVNMVKISCDEGFEQPFVLMLLALLQRIMASLCYKGITLKVIEAICINLKQDIFGNHSHYF